MDLESFLIITFMLITSYIEAIEYFHSMRLRQKIQNSIDEEVNEMYRSLIAMVVAAFAFFTMYVSQPAFAQQNSTPDNGGGTYNQAPNNSSDNQAGGSTSNNDQGGFDWRWLLPLLAIPLLFLIRSDNRSDDRSEYRGGQFAGAKGGRAKKDRDDTTEDYKDTDQ